MEKLRTLRLVLIFFAAVSSVAAADLHTLYGNLGARFEANRGQADPRVRFLSIANGYTVWFSPGEVAVNFRDASKRQSVRMRFGDPRHPSAPEAVGPSISTSNIFLGRDPDEWLTDIPNFERIRYSGVYPGVDLIFYGTRSRLEYDFVVAPGADPGKIHLAFSGAQPIADSGGLRFKGDTCDLQLNPPFIWQETAQGRRSVEGHFVVHPRGLASFAIAAYDHSLPLVIDPTISLAYATFLGGSSGDQGENIAVDPQGNAYVTGYAQSADFPVKSAYQSIPIGVFVTKFSADGSQIFYSTFIGPSDQAAIAVDSAGNAYLALTVTGVSGVTGGNFPTTPNAFEPTYSFAAASAIVKLSPGGNSLLYSTFFEAAIGGQGPNVVRAIAADNAGNVFVTGSSGRTDFPVTGNAYQPTVSNLTDSAAVVARINTLTSGRASLAYASYFVGTPGVAGWAVATDGALNAYVAGQVRAGTIPTRNAFQNTSGGVYDVFVAKFNTAAPTGDASLVYASYLGGSAIEAPAGIAADAAGNAYVGGYTTSTDFPISANAYQNTNTGGGSCFAVKIIPSGSALAWSTYFGSANAYPAGIDIDASGNVYLAGRGIVPQVNALSQAGPGGEFAATLSSDGSSLIFSSSFLAGANIAGIAVHPNGDFYLTGAAMAGFTATPGAFQTNLTGGFDAFAARIGFGGKLGGLTVSSLSPVEGGEHDIVIATVNGAGFVAGATVSLSQNGSPLVSGSSVTVASGGASLTATFDLNGAALGTYDVVVTNPDGTSATRGSAFTVVTSVFELTTTTGGQGYVSTVVQGITLPPGSTLALVMNGQPNIVPTSVQGYSQEFAVSFDLHTAPVGTYDVVITNPDGSSEVLDGGFTIVSGGAPNLYVDVIGRAGIRGGQPQTYLIFYGNSGNMDASGVPLTIQIPDFLQYTLPGGLTPVPQVPPSGPIDYTNMPIDSASGGVRSIPLYLPYIPAGSSGAIEIEVTLPDEIQYAHINFNIEADIANPFFGSPMNASAEDCITKAILAGIAAASIAPVPGFQAAADGALSMFGSYAGSYSGVGNIPAQPASTAQTALGVVGLVAAIVGIAYPPAKLVAAGIGVVNFLLYAGPAIQSCNSAFQPAAKITKIVNAVVSHDPNEKSGAVGAGQSQFITGLTPLRYSVAFENDAGASGSAQTAVVTDQLDPSKVNVSSFSFGPVVIGTLFYNPPPLQKTLASDIDLRPANNIIAHVNGNFDPSTGLATWTFTSIDPSTGKPTTDPFAGFLPPDTSPPQGEGSVTFTVNSLTGDATGTQIVNQAIVTFDQNAPITTAAWTNTLDVTPPVSQVQPLPSTEPTASFQVSWSGSDVGSGIASYTIYVSVNGGPFAVWQQNTTAVSATYSGLANNTYGFYSIAQDNAGNMEAGKSLAEATTQIVLSSPQPAPVISSNGVVNAGSFVAGPIAPGELVSIFGQNLGPQTLAGAVANSSGGIDSSLAGVSVMIGNLPAVVLAASSTQANVVAPFEIVGNDTVPVQLIYNGVASNTVTVPVARTNPGIFTVNFGSGPAAALNQDGTINSAANPAHPGTMVSFYWTGAGVTNPPAVDGLLSAPPYPLLATVPAVTIGGLPAPVSYAGVAPGLVAGVSQLNAQIDPSAPSGSLTVSFQTADGTSQPGVTIAVSQ